MVSFDARSDTRFLSSLQDLGTFAQEDVLRTLDDIAQKNFEWQHFVDLFGWEALNLAGSDTFPGANELHQFSIEGHAAQKYKVVGYTQENVVIICAIARAG